MYGIDKLQNGYDSVTVDHWRKLKSVLYVLQYIATVLSDYFIVGRNGGETGLFMRVGSMAAKCGNGISKKTLNIQIGIKSNSAKAALFVSIRYLHTVWRQREETEPQELLWAVISHIKEIPAFSLRTHSSQIKKCRSTSFMSERTREKERERAET